MNQGKYWMLTCNELSDAYVKVTNEGQRENARGMSARRVITMSVLFRHIYKATAPPCPRKSLGWGVVAGSCWIVLKTAVKRDAVLCGATCRKIFVFQLTSRLRVVLPRNF